MVSPCSSKKKSAEIKELATKTSTVTGQKSLARHKFYLDLKNQHISNKLQTQIKDLGGEVELFLVKEVTCLITDKETWVSAKDGQGTFRDTNGAINESFTNGASTHSRKDSRPKTRADAMLERARCGPAILDNDPLETASQWGITIWSVEKAFKRLEQFKIKLAKSRKLSEALSKVFHFKAPYIKFEAFDRKSRPVVREVKDWPTLNWDGAAGSPAFICRSQVERNMTRKTRINQNDTLQPGYCQVCRLEYSQLNKHLQSEKHQKYINDNANFISLDTLIDEGAGIESFLKIHCVEDKMCDSDQEYSPPTLRRRMPQNRANSLCSERVRRLPLSPTGSEHGGHRLRSRTHVNYVISTPTEEDYPIKPEGAKEVRELRSNAKAMKLIEDVEKTDLQETWESGRPKRSCTIEPEQEIWCSNRPRRACTMYNDHDTWDSGRPKRACTLIDNRISDSEIFDSGRPKRSCTLGVVENEVFDSGRPRRACTLAENRVEEMSDCDRPRRSFINNKKRASADERLVVDNRSYYKVEVLSSKLRSSTLGVIKENEVKRPKTPVVEGSANDKGLIVKFRKIRNSELNFLNSEAENFLFPKKDDASEGDPDDDGPNTTVSSYKNDSTLILSSENEQERPNNRNVRVKLEDDHSLDSTCSDSSARKKKRRTHAEAFILDNQKYYKFETPGSRLRYQGSFLPLVGDVKALPKSNGDCTEVKASPEESKDKTEVNKNLENMKFSFEVVPKSEAWYETFERQDHGEVVYHVLSDPEDWRQFLLPYQLPPLPPLDPKICVSAFQLKKKLLESSSASTSDSSCAPPETGESTSKETEEMLNQDEDSSASTATTDTGSLNIKSELMKIIKEQKPKSRAKNKKALVVQQQGKNPRKSPRQHASTLAILSSLVNHRRRKSILNKSGSGSKELSVIPEEPKEPEPDYEKLANDIDKMFEDFDGVDEVEVPDVSEGINIHYEPDPLELLEIYDQRKNKSDCFNFLKARRVSSVPLGRRPLRKRKKNRTGWPNKSRRIYRKNCEDDSTIDSLSVNSDNECAPTDVNSVPGSPKLESSVVTDQRQDGKNRVRSAGDSDCLNVDLDKWENAEKVLAIKLSNSPILQPVVRVQKLDNNIVVKHRLRSSSSPIKRKHLKPRISPKQSPPKSPRALRKPRGRWYRER